MSPSSTESSWGVTYAGTTDLETAARAAEAASAEMDMKCERSALGASGLRIHAVQQRPWYLIVLKAMPQRVVWRLEPSGEELSIHVDFRPFRWYAVTLVFFGLAVAGSLFAGLHSVDYPWPTGLKWLGPVLQGLFFVALFFSVFLLILLGPLGGGRNVQAIWQPVLRQVEKAGGHLEPRGRVVSRRYTLALSIYAAVFLAFVSLPLYQALSATTVLLVTLMGVLVFAVVEMFKGAGYMLRSEALLGGLVSLSSIILYLGMPLMMAPLAPTAEELLAAAATLQLQQESVTASSELAELRHFVGGLLFAGTSLMLLLFVSVVLYGARLTLAAWVTVWRLQRRRGQGVWSEAVREPEVLRRFRRSFVSFWALSSVLVFAAFGFNLLCTLQGFAPFSSQPQLRLVELSAGTLALALGRPLEDPTVVAAVRAGWVLYSLSVLALLAASVGQLVSSQRRDRRRLQDMAGDAGLQRVLDRLCGRSGHPHVHLAVAKDPAVWASSAVFGFWRVKRFIVISSGSIELLEQEDLEALLAHELAHHSEGHCRADQLLRWLGRLSFAGDAFALLMQGSWSYEEEADRAAVSRLGVPREALLHCFMKIRQLKAEATLPPASEPFTGLKALPEEPEEIEELLDKGPAALPFGKRWRLVWQVLREQYVNAMKFYYWHPSDRIRKQTIRSL